MSPYKCPYLLAYLYVTDSVDLCCHVQHALQSATIVLHWIPALVDARVLLDGTVRNA